MNSTHIELPENDISEWYNQTFSLIELERALSSCNSKSPGPDQIPYELIKQFSTHHKQELLKIYNHFWKNNSLPEQWKQSTTIPIYKAGKPRHEASSYRPIALTNCLAKIFERLVTIRLKKFLETNNIIINEQNGFRAGYSTIDSLCQLENDIRTSFIKGESTLAVFLDITQAFDSVRHDILIRKIIEMGIKGRLLKFIIYFLTGRQTTVRVMSAISGKYNTTCGVPQGCVIVPILFLIMINDIFKDAELNIKFSIAIC